MANRDIADVIFYLLTGFGSLIFVVILPVIWGSASNRDH
jgi:hypothetical protein